MLYVLVHAALASADGARAIDDEARLLARLVLLQPTRDRQRHARHQRLEQLPFLWVLQPVVVHQGHLDGDGAWAGDWAAPPALLDVHDGGEGGG